MVTTRSRLPEPQNPTSPNPQNGLQIGLSRPLENFKAAMLRVSAEKLNRPLTEAEVDMIETYLAGKAQSLSHTPDHPPYAAMIHTALLELNEEGGSSEESISNFIIKKFPDLPLAHSAYLKHYLRRLCDNSEILKNSGNCYLLVDESVERDEPNTEPRKRWVRSQKSEETRKQKTGTTGFEIVVRDEQNKVTKELKEDELEDVESEAEEHKPMKIRVQLSTRDPKMETIESGYLPLAVVDDDQHVDYVKTEKIYTRRKRKVLDQNKNSESASTNALILGLTQPNCEPQEQVKRRGRGRPRKIISSEEIKAEKLEPKSRGNP